MSIFVGQLCRCSCFLVAVAGGNCGHWLELEAVAVASTRADWDPWKQLFQLHGSIIRPSGVICEGVGGLGSIVSTARWWEWPGSGTAWSAATPRTRVCTWAIRRSIGCTARWWGWPGTERPARSELVVKSWHHGCRSALGHHPAWMGLFGHQCHHRLVQVNGLPGQQQLKC